MAEIKNKFSVGRVIAFIFLTLWCLVFFSGLLWLVLASLKGRVQYVTDKVNLPTKWEFKNYIEAFTSLDATGKSVPVMVWNTLWRVFGCMITAQISQQALAYVIAKYKFWGRNAIYWTSIITMMIPVYGTMAASIKMYEFLGFYNSPLIIFSTFGIGGILIPISCYRSLSWTYAEAAFIEGAGHFTVFFKIMLPQVVPVITALCVTSFIGAWNDYMTPIIYMPDYPSLATGLYMYEIECERTMNYPVLFAGLIMSVLPALALFITFQGTFLQLDISGGLKG